jgi:subtilisin
MKYLVNVWLLVGLLFFVACSGDDEPTKQIDDDDCLVSGSSISGKAIEGEYIVAVDTPDAGGRTAGVARILEENNLSSSAISDNFQGSYSYYVMKLNADDADALRTDARIRAVEPDRHISACGCFEVVEPRTVTWNVQKVGFGDGTGKTAWIIDTGIDSDHPDLNVDKTRSRGFDGTSFEDDSGHGTHIAGVIGALNNDIGILGVASGASIVALKVLDENGDGKLSGLLNALTYVRSNAKAGDVVNISISFKDASTTLENEIQSLANRGIYFTLAAGNNSEEANLYSPGRTSGKNIYTITAVDSLNNFASFSNFGNDVVDYAAPGVRILSTYSEGRYAYLSGTSMAAPHIAGLLLINNGKINSSGFSIGDPDGVGDPIGHQ